MGPRAAQVNAPPKNAACLARRRRLRITRRSRSPREAMTTSQHRIEIRRPDDWHLHLRDGAMMRAVLPWTVRQFARAIVMPNLVPPIATVAAAKAYRERILAALPAGASFTPLMPCYVGDATDDETGRAHA